METPARTAVEGKNQSRISRFMPGQPARARLRITGVLSDHGAILFQFFARYSAVRHAMACTVSVGFRAPLVPITEAPRKPRFGTSCEKPHPLTTFVAGLSPIRVPP